MTKTFKIISLSILSLIAILIIGIILLVTLVNPNNYKETISEHVAKTTGRNFEIKGNISWTLFPWLGLQVSDITLGNAPGFKTEKFAQIKDADISIRLLPLITAKFELGNLELKGLVLNLTRLPNGKNNWQDLIEKESKPTTQKPTPTITKEETQTMLPIRSLDISSVTISDANIHWDDQQNKQKFTIAQLYLKSKNIQFGNPFSIETQFIFEETAPKLRSDISLDARVTLDPANQHYQLQNLRLKGQLSGPTIPQGKANVHLSADVDADIKNQTFKLSDLNASVDEFSASGDIRGTQIVDKPNYQGKLETNTFNLKRLLADLGYSVPRTRNSKAMSRVKFTSRFNADDQKLNFTQLNILLDASTLTGTATIANFKTSYTLFNLNLNHINLDDYLPPQQRAHGPQNQAKELLLSLVSGTAATHAAKTKQGSELFPVDLIRSLNLKGQLRIGKMIFSNLTLQSIYLAMTANNGSLSISPIQARLYKGTLSGDTNINVQSSTPNLSVNGNLKEVQIAPLLHDYDQIDLVSGTLDLQCNLHATGQSTSALVQNLNGTSRFALNNGILNGIDIGYEIKRADAFFKKSKAPQKPHSDQTSFGSLTGSATIQNGVVRNRDLVLQSPIMVVRGDGKANLVNEALDYHVNTTIHGDALDPITRELQDILGGSIPIRVTGTISDPKLSPDFAAITQGLAKGVIKKTLEKTIKKPFDDKNGIQEKLKRFIPF